MEALSYAVMAELPLIVINVQRGGPSTGLPTNVEQSDLMQAIYGSHGDAPRVVLAPKNVEDCFYIAIEAVRIAKKYSCPVIILTDQSISSRIEAFEEPDLDKHWVEPTLDLSPHPLLDTTVVVEGTGYRYDPDDALSGRPLFIRSAPGGGKTSLLKLFTTSVLQHLVTMKNNDAIKDLFSKLKGLGAVSDHDINVLAVMLPIIQLNSWVK